jgi:cysteine desulfurase/selenocysteine lyase
MISSVSLDEVRYNVLPAKFEAGTPNIAGAIGLAAAIRYYTGLDREGARTHEENLVRHALGRLSDASGVRVVGRASERTGVVSFVMENVHPHDIGTVLDGEGIAVRAGHHCCQPLMQRLGVDATVRLSVAPYNTVEEIDTLVAALDRVREMFA